MNCTEDNVWEEVVLNRLFMAVHWILFLWVLCWPLAIIITLVEVAGIRLFRFPREADEFLWIGGVGFVVYIPALWIIKGRWTFCPWQHDKD